MGRVALVTGAAVGIGRGIAEGLAANGAHLALCDMKPSVTEVAADLARRHGVRTSAWMGDVADPEHVWAVVDGALATFGGVDILINNVGTWLGSRVTDPLDRAIATYERLMAVNTRPAFLFGRALIPQMQRIGRGDIVNIGTDHSYTEPERPTGGGESMDVYDATKWAINGLTLAWARALEGVVRVNEISMGRTDSEMLRGFSPDSSPEEIASWKTPADIAGLIIGLLEEGPGGRTGFNLPVWWMDPIVVPAADAPWEVRVGTMKATGI